MKKVAIIAPQFLPCSYPPTHRVRFFAKHLRQFGWESIILCVESQFMEEPEDEELTRMLNNEFRTINVRALSPSWTRLLGIGDLGIRCFPYMLRRVRKLCKEEKLDMLFIPGPPWHTFLIGRLIKQEFGIPYVIDYIDPWVMSLGKDDPPWKKAYWFRKMAMVLEPWALKNVDHVVAVSDGTNEEIRRRYSNLGGEMFTGIPFGGEPSDFAYLRNNPRGQDYWDSRDGALHLVYVGAMLPKGYATLRTLFAACLHLQKREPSLGNRIRLHFFGTTYDPNPQGGLVGPIAKEMGLEDVVKEYPRRIPYLDAANLLCRADIILALGTTEHHYTASKIFSCLLANRPLLAIYHELSSVVTYLEHANRGPVITYNDEQTAETRVISVANRISEIVSSKITIPDLEISQFETLTACSMAKRLADVFNELTNQ
jgi:glycosyltransferase involved in cell wall biosynthesis